MARKMRYGGLFFGLVMLECGRSAGQSEAERSANELEQTLLNARPLNTELGLLGERPQQGPSAQTDDPKTEITNEIPPKDESDHPRTFALCASRTYGESAVRELVDIARLNQKNEGVYPGSIVRARA